MQQSAEYGHKGPAAAAPTARFGSARWAARFGSVRWAARFGGARWAARFGGVRWAARFGGARCVGVGIAARFGGAVPMGRRVGPALAAHFGSAALVLAMFAAASPARAQVSPATNSEATPVAQSGPASVEGPASEAAAAASSIEPQQLTPLTLVECIRQALAQNLTLRSARDDVAVAERERAASRGQFGPKLRVDGSFQRWNEAYLFNGFPIHDISQWNVTASLTQPVTTLLSIYDNYKLRDLGVDIAGVRRDVQARGVAFDVVSHYYRLLEAEKLIDVANASLEQLGAQLKQSRSFHDNGVVSRDDVLRAELALQGAEQRAIVARARVTIERSELAVSMGLPPDSPIDAQPPPRELLTRRAPLPLERAETVAQTRRSELREIDQRIAQADAETRIAYWKLVPQVSLVGAYIHNEGSPLTPTNSGYVGAVASWEAWDWGSTESGISEAKVRAHQAALARAKLADQIRLEVRRAFVNVGASAEAIKVAESSVAAAEENFRLVKKRYEASAATSFDVVDAEGLLTQARGQLQNAVYDLLIANAALLAATGAPPEALARPAP